MNQDAQQSTWTAEGGKQYPLFAFDKPVTVTLPNGTKHQFRVWDEVTEKKREDLLKTVIVSSPAIINGESPRDVKTDFTRSALAYYAMMIEKIGGVIGEGGQDENGWLDAQAETGGFLPDGKPAKVYDLLGASIRKAAALRLYSGKIEVEKPEDEDEDFEGDPFDEDDIQRQVDRAEKQKEIYHLTLERNIVIRQEIGVEAIGGSGRTTDPTHLIRHHLREPQGPDFSKWELKGFRGYSIGLKKGGEKSERFYNLDTIKVLYDSLIERVEGASVNGAEFNLPSDRSNPTRKSLLELVPLPIKKLIVATLFSEMNSLGNG